MKPGFVAIGDRDGTWKDVVSYKSKFMAWLFCVILNKSASHKGFLDDY